MDAGLDELVRQALAGDAEEVALEFAARASQKSLPVKWGYLTRVAAQVNTLLTEAGLGRCSAIGFVPRNRPSFAAALLSLIGARRSIVMVYAFQSPTAIAADLRKLALPAVIIDAQDWTAETQAAVDPKTIVIALDSDLAAAEPVRLVNGALEADRDHLRGPTPDAVIELLTSGTTGAPKRAPTLYQTFEHGIIKNSVLDAGRGAGQKGEPGTVNFPLSNISGIYSFVPMAVARRLVLFQEKFDVRAWADFIRRHRPKVAILPPAGIRGVLDAKVPRADLEGVRYISAGTTTVDPVAHKEFEATYGITILLSYGATEFAGAATAMTAELHAKYGDTKFGSVGRASGSNEVRVVDPVDKHILPPGEVGIIEVKVPVLGDSFITTTDLGMLDEDGFLFHRGRADGVIMRGGFKVLPVSVEAVLNAFPGVEASCVVGVPEPRLGQVPVAVVEMQPGIAAPEPKALETHLRASLPAPHIPVKFLVTELPRTPSLKIDLKEVRALAARHMASASESLAS
jgi:acyl-coenzyme A synthetase/AMP-(fatty) acid ligase